MAFSTTGLMVNAANKPKVVAKNVKKTSKATVKVDKGKKKNGGSPGNNLALNECLGVKVVLQGRTKPGSGFGSYNIACSARCRHPAHFHRGQSALVLSHGIKSDDWISEHIYKRYTDTDSRPLSPNFEASLIKPNLGLPKIGTSRLLTTKEKENQTQRKCLTPEPETKPCQFHPRRVLILDLRRVKSVDAIVKQESITTNDTESLYGDDDGDKTDHSSTPFPQSFSPRHLSVSRSVTPKIKIKSARTYRKRKNRCVSPMTYERSTSPKILEGVSKVTD